MQNQQDVLESALKTGKLSKSFLGREVVNRQQHTFTFNFYRCSFTKGVWDLRITSMNYNKVYETEVSWEQVVAFIKRHYSDGSAPMKASRVA